MSALDSVSQRYGRRTLSPAAAGIAHSSWSMRQQKLSPRYTTDFDVLLTARLSKACALGEKRDV